MCREAMPEMGEESIVGGRIVGGGRIVNEELAPFTFSQRETASDVGMRRVWRDMLCVVGVAWERAGRGSAPSTGTGWVDEYIWLRLGSSRRGDSTG